MFTSVQPQSLFGTPTAYCGRKAKRRSALSAVDEEFRKEMLERELHGIDIELQIRRLEHLRTTKAIEQLEKDRQDIVALLI